MTIATRIRRDRTICGTPESLHSSLRRLQSRELKSHASAVRRIAMAEVFVLRGLLSTKPAALKRPQSGIRMLRQKGTGSKEPLYR
jgi:hypothetical protein